MRNMIDKIGGDVLYKLWPGLPRYVSSTHVHHRYQYAVDKKLIRHQRESTGSHQEQVSKPDRRRSND